MNRAGPTEQPARERSERFEQGIAIIQRMFPNEETRAMPIPAYVRRDWGMFTVETVMGEIWARPGLGPRERSAITITALAVLSRSEELSLHVRAALRNGLTRHEVSEVLLHLTLYAGAPLALDALRTAETVFQAHPDLGDEGDPGTPDPELPADPIERGRAIVRRLFPRGALRGVSVPEEIAADWSAFLLGSGFAAFWGRPGLDFQMRSRITVAALTVLHRPEELKLHLRVARNLGLSRAEISEILMHLAIYGGVPVAVEGLRLARAAFEEDTADGRSDADGAAGNDTR